MSLPSYWCSTNASANTVEDTQRAKSEHTLKLFSIDKKFYETHIFMDMVNKPSKEKKGENNKKIIHTSFRIP